MDSESYLGMEDTGELDMKILFLTPRLPFPLNRGDRIRPFHFARRLSNKHTLYLLSFIQSTKEKKHFNELRKVFDRVETVLLNKKEAFSQLLRYSFNSLPLQVSYYESKRMRTKVQSILDDTQPDIIYVYHLRMAPYFVKSNNYFRILDLADSVSLFFKRMSRYSKFYERAIFLREYHSLKNYEPYLIQNYDRCWVTSKWDKMAIEGSKKEMIQIIPNGVDTEYFKPQRTNRLPDSLLFVGYMGRESVDATLNFYYQILPSIRRDLPSTQLYLVGSNPPPKISRLTKDPLVTVTGFVRDLRPFYNMASLFVAPLRFVVGIQNKILEAMAMELPVVTTKFGNEGINASVEEGVFVADNPLEFAHLVLKLLKDERLRRELGVKARKFVEERFNWNTVSLMLDEIATGLRG